MTLAGILCCRNCLELDYSWREAGQSLLGACDELVIGDSDSTDGTRQAIDEWAAKDTRITVCSFPWTNPIANKEWYPLFINYVRQHAKSQMILHLDADELIHEDDYPAIRKAADAGATLFLKRLNFWKDPQHLIPEGHCCGTKVLRMAPANMAIPSDYPWEPASATMSMAVESDIRVFHYGFLRKREAFFKKARTVHRIWHGSFDPRLEQAEKFDGPWATMPGVTGWENDLVKYNGAHPAAGKPWLIERGYKV